MAKYTYPAIFTEEKEGGYSVEFIDVNAATQGDSLENALYMAEDALCLILYDMKERGKTIPKASNIKSVKIENGQFIQYISCNTDFYKKYFEKKAIRKNVTIPSWLDYEAERAGINFSAVLQEALRQKLGDC